MGSSLRAASAPARRRRRSRARLTRPPLSTASMASTMHGLPSKNSSQNYCLQTN
ncbi:hypothetical protein SEVIR_8G006900v4 [Setaria viridis]